MNHLNKSGFTCVMHFLHRFIRTLAEHTEYLIVREYPCHQMPYPSSSLLAWTLGQEIEGIFASFLVQKEPRWYITEVTVEQVGVLVPRRICPLQSRADPVSKLLVSRGKKPISLETTGGKGNSTAWHIIKADYSYAILSAWSLKFRRLNVCSSSSGILVLNLFTSLLTQMCSH